MADGMKALYKRAQAARWLSDRLFEGQIEKIADLCGVDLQQVRSGRYDDRIRRIAEILMPYGRGGLQTKYDSVFLSLTEDQFYAASQLADLAHRKGFEREAARRTFLSLNANGRLPPPEGALDDLNSNLVPAWYGRTWLWSYAGPRWHDGVEMKSL